MLYKKMTENLSSPNIQPAPKLTIKALSRHLSSSSMQDDDGKSEDNNSVGSCDTDNSNYWTASSSKENGIKELLLRCEDSEVRYYNQNYNYIAGSANVDMYDS